MMPVCKKCGYQNKEGSKYCVNCGHPLESILEEVKPFPKTSTIVTGFIVSIIFIAITFGSWWLITLLTTPKTATFYIEIESNTSWMGVIGGDGSMRSINGYGSQTWKLTGYRVVSAVIQKQTEEGYLTVRILKDGKVVDKQTTTAPYGIVSVSATS